MLCPADTWMILNSMRGGSIGKLETRHHVQPLPMPVTIVARTTAEPTLGNLRFIDIGGKASIVSPRHTAHEITIPSEPLWSTEIFYEYSLNRCGASDDLDVVLERTRLAGVKSMVITGGSLHESKEALQLAETHGSLLT
jgi:hypothetical protein